jgi:hypothetical protein
VLRKTFEPKTENGETSIYGPSKALAGNFNGKSLH